MIPFRQTLLIRRDKRYSLHTGRTQKIGPYRLIHKSAGRDITAHTAHRLPTQRFSSKTGTGPLLFKPVKFTRHLDLKPGAGPFLPGLTDLHAGDGEDFLH